MKIAAPPDPLAALPVPGALAGSTPGPAAAGRRVARSVLDHGPSTAAELAERLAITPAAVRRHLDTLLAEGLLEARDQRVRGPRGRGRPAKAFHLTPAGRDALDHPAGAPDTSYDDLALDALDFLAEHGGEGAVEAFARRRLSLLEASLRPVVDAVPAQEQVAALAGALSGLGYAASPRTTDAGSTQLCQHHCPVSHVAERFPQLCEAETEMFARLLGTHVQRLATIAHGDGVCTTHVPTSRRTTA